MGSMSSGFTRNIDRSLYRDLQPGRVGIREPMTDLLAFFGVNSFLLAAFGGLDVSYP